MNKFELVSSDDHQMSLPGGVPGLIFGCGGRAGSKDLYSEGQCIMSNGHLGSP